MGLYVSSFSFLATISPWLRNSYLPSFFLIRYSSLSCRSSVRFSIAFLIISLAFETERCAMLRFGVTVTAAWVGCPPDEVLSMLDAFEGGFYLFPPNGNSCRQVSRVCGHWCNRFQELVRNGIHSEGDFGILCSNKLGEFRKTFLVIH